MANATLDIQMAKHRKTATTEAEPRRYGTMIRVSDDFAEAVRKACAMENVTVAEFADRYFSEIAKKRYRELIAQEYAKQRDMMGGQGGGM